MGVFQTQQRGVGDFLGRVTGSFINRTGASLLKGQLAAVDLLDTQTEVTAGDFVGGSETSVFANLTPITQAIFEEGTPIVACLDVSVADNSKGLFLVWGVGDIAVSDDDISTTDIDKGDRVSMIIAESAVAAKAFVTGGTGSRVIGIALEDAAASSTNTDRTIDASSHRRTVIFTGGMPVLGSTDT